MSLLIEPYYPVAITTNTSNQRPRANMAALRSSVAATIWNQCYRARCAHINALESFPFFAASMLAGSFVKQ
jgi:uncharacterized MAPEG superfamily protein